MQQNYCSVQIHFVKQLLAGPRKEKMEVGNVFTVLETKGQEAALPQVAPGRTEQQKGQLFAFCFLAAAISICFPWHGLFLPSSCPAFCRFLVPTPGEGTGGEDLQCTGKITVIMLRAGAADYLCSSLCAQSHPRLARGAAQESPLPTSTFLPTLMGLGRTWGSEFADKGGISRLVLPPCWINLPKAGVPPGRVGVRPHGLSVAPPAASAPRSAVLGPFAVVFYSRLKSALHKY